MTFKLEINCDNAAFEDSGICNELKWITDRVGKRLANRETTGNIYDSNGNKVGTFKLS
ncbi:hypothetical protein KAR91_33860 [Candidatus Pacearchaeota archaeon]|nr:hypothetical protein [Candidatus Pacearchaeota archaeon]